MAKSDFIAVCLINEKLLEIRIELNLHFNELRQQGICFSVDKMRHAYLGVKSKIQMLGVFRE
jgi:hypothetical protein